MAQRRPARGGTPGRRATPSARSTRASAERAGAQVGNVQCGLAPQAGAYAAPGTALHVPPPARPAPCSATGSTQTIFAHQLHRMKHPARLAHGAARHAAAHAQAWGHLGPLTTTRGACSLVSSHAHAPRAGLACGGPKLHLGSLMMTRMACSQVHSEPHLTAASSSLNASLASSCAAARARASARPGGRLHAQRGAANLKISNPRYLHAAARCEGLSLCRARPRALQACPAALCGLQAPCYEQGPALARPDRELSVLASRFPTLSVPLRTVQQHRPAAPGRRRALDAYMNAPSACGAASAGAAAGAPTGAAAAPAAAAAGAATPLAVEAAATRADAAAAGMATSAGDAAAAGSSFTTCKNCRSQHAELIYVCMYVM